MKTIKQEIAAFDGQIAKAHQDVDGHIQKISAADWHIKQYIHAFRTEIGSLNIQSNNRYDTELQKLFTECQAQCANWCDAIDDMMSGKEFINQFERSLLVVVFGNVNVGKSSVGNLIAGVIDQDEWAKDSANKPSQEEMSSYFGSVPDFYEYDLAGSDKAQGPRKANQPYFKEGHVETTANIQYFTRNEGLTWTDSPGICSVTKQNGDLAKKYVEFADLVIFVTTSSSPAKFDEIQELVKLFSKEKRFLILINKSDKWEKDEVDGQLVKMLRPKSKEDRAKQESYTLDTFQKEVKAPISELDAVSVSTHLALKALKEGDTAAFEDSGYPRFFKKLGEICGKDAVDLKMAAPQSRVNSMVNEILHGGSLSGHPVSGIQEYQKQMKQLLDMIQTTKINLDKAANNAVPQISSEVINQIISLVHDASREALHGKKTTLDDKVNQIITQTTVKILQQKFAETLKDESVSVQTQTGFHSISGIQIAPTEESIERTVYEAHEVSRDPHGIIEHLESWFLGTEFTETKVTSRQVRDSFISGDNSSQAGDKAIKQVTEQINGYVNAVKNEMQQDYFGKAEDLIDSVLKKFQNLETKIRRERLES